MTRIHNNEVKNIAEYNLLHDIINPPKSAKDLNSRYSPIIRCMNTRQYRSRFKNFRILLDSGCSSKIVIGRLVNKLGLEKDSLVQWNTQAGNITTNLKVDVYFTLPVLRSTYVVTWKCKMDESTEGRYNMSPVGCR